MDVFHNPVTLQYLKSLNPGSKACRDDRYMDSIYLALKRLSVIVKQPMDFQSIVVEFSFINDLKMLPVYESFMRDISETIPENL